MSDRPRRRLLPQKLRTRLTVLYALLFLGAGCALLGVTYALVASRLPAPSTSARDVAKQRQLLALCKQQPPYKPTLIKRPQLLLDQCKKAFSAGAQAAARTGRDRTLSSLLLASTVGLALLTIGSAGLGWILAGRALRPVKQIASAARRASQLHLGERVALTGPDDELKELADTFDEMLERLDRAFASQKRFVANAAHELRTPLTAMRTSIEVTLSKPTRTPEQLEAMAAKIQRGIQRSEATVDALLALAVSEQAPSAQQPVDLATAAEDALDGAAPAIAERNLAVHATLQPAPARGEPVLLERMIANLVDNAVRHNKPGGWIRVQTTHQDSSTCVKIENTGPRVAPDTIPTLFEPFARAEQRLNPANGIGLGLPIARAIATAHRATMDASSRPDGGLVVSVQIPWVDPTSDVRSNMLPACPTD